MESGKNKVNILDNMTRVNKITLILLTALCCLSSCDFNPFNKKTLKGKKFYAITSDIQSNRRMMGSIPITFKTIAISEVEFFFLSDSNVVVTPTVVYVNLNKDFFQIFLKHMESQFLPKEYLYRYENGALDIFEGGFEPIKIEEHDKFYSTSDGDTFYKESITSLTKEEKRNRIEKIVAVKDDDMEQLLASELLLSDKAIQEANRLLNEVKANNDEVLGQAKRAKDEIDKAFDTDENIDTYVKLYDHQLLYKVENYWPDRHRIQTIYYLGKDHDNQVVRLVEEPYSQSGDWYMCMTHYFRPNGRTFATERVNNTYYLDSDVNDDNPIFITGQLYKRSLVKFFDRNFNQIEREYKLTDADNKKMDDPSGENLDIVGEYKDFVSYASLIDNKTLDFERATVFSD